MSFLYILVQNVWLLVVYSKASRCLLIQVLSDNLANDWLVVFFRFDNRLDAKRK